MNLLPFKPCTKCGEEKPLTFFSPNKRNKNGRQPHCKSCCARYMAEYRKKHGGKKREKGNDPEKQWVYRLRSVWGMDEQEYFRMIENQGGGCAICGAKDGDRYRSHSSRRRRLVVDHCHETERIRGLLCSRCNKAIGLFEDKEELFVKAIGYLRKATSEESEDYGYVRKRKAA